MAEHLRIYCAPRDVTSLPRYLTTCANVALVRLPDGDVSPSRIAAALRRESVDVAIQIAPQWEWGRYVEDVCMDIMNAGVKLICGEGVMFRWLGELSRAGSDVGFYLAPWGYSGNSKLAQELPPITHADMLVAERLCSQVPRWNPGPEQILIVGQQEYDRARYFRGPTRTNRELLEKAIGLWGQERLLFRPHPLGETMRDCPVPCLENSTSLQVIVHKFAAVVSANSTASIEGICAGVPVLNDGVGPWGGSPVVQPMVRQFKAFPYDLHVRSVAALASLHWLPLYSYGHPLPRALEFYSDHDPGVFSFQCLRYEDEPSRWSGSYYWEKGQRA